MDIRPIHTEADYKTTLKEISALRESDPDLGTPEGDRLDILATLGQAYEAKHVPITAPDPVEAIKFRMDQSGLSVKDLEPIIGKSNRVYEVLSRKRPLTLAMIRRLHKSLGIPADVLIAETAAGLSSNTELGFYGEQRCHGVICSGEKDALPRDDRKACSRPLVGQAQDAATLAARWRRAGLAQAVRPRPLPRGRRPRVRAQQRAASDDAARLQTGLQAGSARSGAGPRCQGRRQLLQRPRNCRSSIATDPPVPRSGRAQSQTRSTPDAGGKPPGFTASDPGVGDGQQRVGQRRRSRQ